MDGVRHDPGLQALVDALHGRGDLPALAVAVLDGGAQEIAWAGAGAAADGPGLRFRVASVTKTVLALTAHRLAGGGAVALGDPVGGGAVLADLLSHTAGLPLELPGVDWLTAPPPDAAALTALLDTGPRAHAGAPFRYSNVGFWRLAAVLTAATAESVEDLVHRTLADLPGTSGISFADADLPGHLATPRGRIVASVATFAPARRPSGGLAADLPSVARLGRALLATTATTPALREERVAIADGWGWTAGLERWTTAGRPLLGHAGSWGGTRTQLVLDPADGRVAVASVTSHGGAPALRALLTAIGLPPATPGGAAPGAPGPLPLGPFGDGPDRIVLRPAGDGLLLLEDPATGASHRARRLDDGLARLLDGPHAGDVLSSTPDATVLRVGVRSWDRAAEVAPAR